MAKKENSLKPYPIHFILHMVIAIPSFIFALIFLARGFDLTDESYYLATIASPKSYPLETGVRNYSWAYHPIFMLTHSLLTLRASSLIITSILAAFMYHSANRYFSRRESDKKVFFEQYLMIVVANIGLVYPFHWLPTPSYNTLALQGALLTFGSIFRLARRNDWVSKTLLACGLFLILLAKPPSAIFFGIIIIICIKINNNGIRPVSKQALHVVTLFVFFTSIFSIVVDHSPEKTIYRVLESYRNLKILGVYSDLMRFDSLSAHQIYPYTIYFFIFYVALKIQKPSKLILIQLFLFSAPMLLAFGTANNYWDQSSFFLVFPLLGFLTMFNSGRRTQRFGYTISILIVIALSGNLIRSGIENPYRQPGSIFSNRLTSLHIRGYGDVYVNQTIANSIENAKNSLAPFNNSTQFRLMDLTGDFPLFAYNSNIQPLGSAWNLTPYPGSTNHEIQTIRSMNCHQTFKLIVISDIFRQSEDTDAILQIMKLNLNRDFILLSRSKNNFIPTSSKTGAIEFYVTRGWVHVKGC